jgi:hypothetical protein
MECGQIMAHSFIADQLAAFYQSPSYGRWLLEHDWGPAYDYHRTILKVLQWKNPRRHWLLKAPHHLVHIPELLRTYPDARLIQTHRDPLLTMASVTDLLGTLYWTRSDQPFNSSAFEGLTFGAGVAAQLENVMALRERGTLHRDNIVDILYRQLVQEPMRAVADIYERLGMTLHPAVAARMQAFLAEKSGAHAGSHRYDVGSAERIARDRPLFRRYQSYYGVPDEV